MLRLTLLLLLLAAPAHAQHSTFAVPPPGSTLPVSLPHTLHPIPGTPITAHLLQRVPLSDHTYLPSSAQLLGTVQPAPPHQLALLFTTLRLHGATLPIHVQLVAAASLFAVQQTQIPIGGSTGRSTSDYTTVQIGGDELLGVNIPTTVLNQYCQPVARADGTGVYAPPLSPGLPERALGPFSTTAQGLYSLPSLTLLSPGSATTPITFTLTTPRASLPANSALLLQVTAP